MFTLLKTLTLGLATRFAQAAASAAATALLHGLEQGHTGDPLKAFAIDAVSGVKDPAQQHALQTTVGGLVDYGEAYFAAKIKALGIVLPPAAPAAK